MRGYKLLCNTMSAVMKWGSMLIVLFLATGLNAEQMPVGKKVKVQLKSGESIVGALRSSDVDKAVIFDGKEDKTFPYSDIEKIVVLSDQRMVVVQEEKPTVKGPRSINRITPVSVSFGSESAGVELCGYEFIGRNGLAIRVTPLSLYGFSSEKKQTYTAYDWYGDPYERTSTYTDEGFYYAPVWMRYYARNLSNGVWPYVGGTLAFHGFDDEGPGSSYSNDEIQTSMRPALDFGIDFGGRTVRGNVGGKAFFGEGGDDKTLIMFSLGLAIGWGG